MTFFNKKEEVLEVQLTRLGRQLLSQGRFKPASYEFMDEDVVYDRQYVMSGSVEEQNEIKTRIKSKLTLRTPTAKQEVKNSQTLEAEAIQIFLQNLHQCSEVKTSQLKVLELLHHIQIIGQPGK